MLRFKNRDSEMEPRTLPNFALHPDAPAMRFDEMFGDGKAKAGPPHFPGARDIHAVEAFEDAGLIYLGNANTGVGDGEGDFLSVGGCGNDNPTSRGRVLNGVVQQVLQDLGEAPAVCDNIRKSPAEIHRNVLVLLSGCPLRGL